MKKKNLALGRLAEHFSQFYAEKKDTFVCPTCLKHIPLSKSSTITRAHIIPQAAGGGLTTWLCNACNSTFGQKQDRWFGEYLQTRGKDVWPLNTPTKSNHFLIDDVRYGGSYGVSDSGTIEFRVHTDRTAPLALDKLKRRLAGEGFGGAAITIKVPLAEHKELVNPGFLTAAYLLWFRALGYSWALQSHLAGVRQQILNPQQAVLPCRYVFANSSTPPLKPWIGLLRVDGEIYLGAGISDRIVVLPARDRPDGDALDAPNKMNAQIRYLAFYEGQGHQGPVGVLFDSRVLVMPDLMLRQQGTGVVAFFADWESPPVPLWPEAADRKAPPPSNAEATTIRNRHKLIIPSADTARDDQVKR